MLGKSGYEAPGMNDSQRSEDPNQLYKPFQSSTAEATFRQFNHKIDQFVTQWNDDPTNRSKMGQLRQQLEETKAVIMEDLELTCKRGQLLEDTRMKSESLVTASKRMKKSSKDVKLKMCCRKYMYYIIGTLVFIFLIVLLWLIIR